MLQRASLLAARASASRVLALDLRQHMLPPLACNLNEFLSAIFEVGPFFSSDSPDERQPDEEKMARLHQMFFLLLR